MMTIKELQAKWSSIPPYTGGFLLVSDDHPLSFHIGYLSGGQKCFIILNTGEIDKISSSKAITVDCIPMDDGTHALRFCLTLLSLDELFIKLCWDLIESSRQAKHSLKRILEQYNNWLRLLQMDGLGLMSASAQKGLIGELLYLGSMIDKYGTNVALSAWVGPEYSDQDFIFSEHWAEIKAVLISADSVLISSLQQLDRDDKGYLVLYFMDKTSAEGINCTSLADVVELMRDKLPAAREKDEFDCKLARYGYLEKDNEDYKAYRYRISEKRIYEVSAAFPRLTRGNVPTEIIAAKYEISLATVNSFRVSEEQQ